MPFVNPTSKLWNPVLTQLNYDFYQVAEYCKLEAKVLKGRSVAWYGIINGFEFVIPLIEREIHYRGIIDRDLVSPYGYSGIAYSSSACQNDIKNAIHLFNDEARNEGFISSFIRLHPIYNTFELEDNEMITQFVHGNTVAIDLRMSLLNIRKFFSNDHKRNLKRISKLGLMVEIDNWNRLDEFVSVYINTMRRKNAASRYFFDIDYFNNLRMIKNAESHLILILDKNRELVSGGIFTICNRLAQFHLSGTVESFLKYSPSRKLIDSAIEFCKYSGADILHLGGGFGANNLNGLFRFKSGFGGRLYNFKTLRLIHDYKKYNQLIQNQKANVDVQDNFFPEYRFLLGY